MYPYNIYHPLQVQWLTKTFPKYFSEGHDVLLEIPLESFPVVVLIFRETTTNPLSHLL